jgi:MFS transporter, ACS family, hexuronate transporter
MVLSMPLALTPWIAGLPAVMFLLSFAMFVAAGFIILSIGYATHVFSAAHAGLIAGLGAGSWGALVAIFMPIFGRLFDQQQHPLSFGVAALAPMAGYSLWYFANRRADRSFALS